MTERENDGCGLDAAAVTAFFIISDVIDVLSSWTQASESEDTKSFEPTSVTDFANNFQLATSSVSLILLALKINLANSII